MNDIDSRSSTQEAPPTRPLYSKLPYPGDGVVRTAVARALRANLQRHRPDVLERQDLRIVDIGSGTGEATLGIARHFPRANVVGLDVNPASLDLARRLAAREARPARFVECDVTQPPARLGEELGGPFDVVVSMGVLHHLRDPAEGFRFAAELAAARAPFLCFMYSRYGRWDDQVAKSLLDRAFAADAFDARAEAVRRLGLTRRQTVGEFLRRLADRVRFGPPIIPLELARTYARRNQTIHDSDTFSNPCEHLYTFAELESLVTNNGWRLLGLARGFGLPTTVEEHTRDPEARRILSQLDRAVLYDYFAFVHRAWGFAVLLERQD